jgi:hypothetical protein
MKAGAAKHHKEKQGQDGPAPEKQITTALMNILDQLKESQGKKDEGDGAEDCQHGGVEGAGSKSAADGLASGQDSDSSNPTSEFTTALMKIFNNLQGHSEPNIDSLLNPQQEPASVPA